MRRRIEIGNRYKDDKRDLTVTDIKVESCGDKIKRRYKYHCNICGYEGWKDNMTQGCAFCTNQVVIKGRNDIATTDPWIIDFLYDKEDGYKYSKGSNAKIKVVCPYCKQVKIVSVSNLYKTKKISCACQGGWSYPNKFIYCFLKQLDVNFEAEKTFEWSNGKRYDDYVVYKNKKIIIENHGQQHYTERQFSDKQTLKSQKANDKYKKDLAIKNNIDYYIILDCRVSDLCHIKKSIMSSKLPTLLDFTENDIDWKKCETFAFQI